MQKAPFTWVLTRAREESRSLRALLRARGVRSVVVPAIERRVGHFPPWPWPVDPSRTRVIFITSPFAVSRVPWAKLRRAGVRVAALEPKCAEAVRAQGVEVTVSASGGTVGLAKALAKYAARQKPRASLDVVYPTSSLGPELPEQRASRAILKRLGRLSVPVVYATVRPAQLGAQVKKLDGQRVGLFFASPSAVENFLAARREQKVRLEVARVVCLGRSTARAWNESKWSSWPKAGVIASTVEWLDVLTKEQES